MDINCAELPMVELDEVAESVQEHLDHRIMMGLFVINLSLKNII